MATLRYLLQQFFGSALVKTGSHARGQSLVFDGTNWTNGQVTMGAYLAADFTGTDVNTAQPLLPSATDTFTLTDDTTYLMQAVLYISTTGTTSHQLGFLFAGTATLESIGYTLASTQTAAMATIGQRNARWVDVATVINSNSAIASASHHNVTIEGLVRVTTGGTFIPQYQWSAAPGAAGVVKKNSSFRLTPIGSASVASVGSVA